MAARKPRATPEPVDIDLDAMRAARAAKVGKGPTVRVDGKKYTLPARLPISALSDIAGLMAGRFDALHRTLVVLFNDRTADELFSKLDVDDVRDLITAIGAKYGVDLGNS